ncbi:MAG: alpha/beta fold hydrolase, partial [Gammaproteobacteria bacterium]
VLNGWSLGGAVAVEAAHQLGETCAGLVLTCAATPCYLQKDGFPHGGTEDALAETLAAMAADRVNFLSGLAAGVCAAEVSDTVIEWMREIFMQASPLAAQALGELGPLDQRSILAELSMPILSFVGANDAVVDPNVCRSVADYNNGTVLVECEASGHAPFIEEPDLYHEHLKAFIDAHL